jgi:hypothetical protein
VDLGRPTAHDEVMESQKSESDLARAALAAAYSRFRRDATKPNVSTWYASLGETLWWIVALDDHYRTRYKSAYERLRDCDKDGYVIPGLLLARNQVGHALVRMLKDPDSPSTVLPSAGLTLKQLVWRPLEDLPPVRKTRVSDFQEAIYRAYLAREPHRFALRHATGFFVRRRPTLDSALR